MKKENQEINNKKETLPKETEEIAEKVSLAEVGKEFLAPEHPELDAKEEISRSSKKRSCFKNASI